MGPPEALPGPTSARQPSSPDPGATQWSLGAGWTPDTQHSPNVCPQTWPVLALPRRAAPCSGELGESTA